MTEHLENPRPLLVETINPELIRFKDDGITGVDVEKGDPNELIVQLNLNYLDHALLVASVRDAIGACIEREKALTVMYRAHKDNGIDALSPLTPDDIDNAIGTCRRKRMDIESLLGRIQRKPPRR